MWSSVGVMYLIRLMRKNGTCKTWFARKSSPLTSASSQVTASKSTIYESTHSVTLTAMIYMGIRSVSLNLHCPVFLSQSLPVFGLPEGFLRGLL